MSTAVTASRVDSGASANREALTREVRRGLIARARASATSRLKKRNLFCEICVVNCKPEMHYCSVQIW